jgi:hypothetical protein
MNSFGGDITRDGLPIFYDELVEQIFSQSIYVMQPTPAQPPRTPSMRPTEEKLRSKTRLLQTVCSLSNPPPNHSRYSGILPTDLFLLCGSRDITLAIGTFSTSPIVCTVVERSCELARTTLQHGGDGDGAVCRGYGGRFGHEVEVQELDELELHFSTCFAGLEEAGNCQEAIKVFEGTGVLRGFDESAYEGYDGCGLDGWAVDGFEEVEEVLK